MPTADHARDAMMHRRYGEEINTRLLSLFKPGKRTLDIGCGSGDWAPSLRDLGARWLAGIEFSDAGASAEPLYDLLVRDSVESVTLADLGGERFDTIIAADVLEHLVDPWAQLARWREWVSPGGEIVVSVPNLRYIGMIRELLVGRFNYTEAGGLMDRTHLRWWTHATMRDDLLHSGWLPKTWGRPDRIDSWKRRLVSRMARGRLDDLFAWQIQVVAGA